ncbi:MAG: DNA mismatch repair protein MutH, partial [Thaumarchaeota archaeon]|nr:DNA mismatch repair protein MutH [Nitrososphaerota archaeon]
KKTGIVSMLIGTLKELRVGHFKQLSKTSTDALKKQQYETISEALKVFLNASYGVIGFSSFPLYFLPTAEAVTAYGREIISQTVKTAREMGLNIIAGDTDSLFAKTPTAEQIKEIISLTNKKYHIDLEQDKEYRYVVFSNRKKNYFGIKTDGTADIKGLSGKKSNTPPFIRELFNNIMGDLKSIQVPEDFPVTRQSITMMIKEIVDHFDNIPLEQLSFKVLITKEPSEYKVKPQALKAAEQLPNKPHKGEFIQYVKIWKEPGVMPISMVDRKYIDKPKYIESLTTTLEQITDPMQIDVEGIISGYKKMKMDDFW